MCIYEQKGDRLIDRQRAALQEKRLNSTTLKFEEKVGVWGMYERDEFGVCMRLRKQEKRI